MGWLRRISSLQVTTVVVMVMVMVAEANPTATHQATPLLAVPPPVQVSSGVVTVLGGAMGGQRQGRAMEVGADGIPIIHGIRVPDDPEGTPIYRNARIVNNKLITADDELKMNQVVGRSVAAAPHPPTPPRQARVLGPRQRQQAGSSGLVRYPDFYFRHYYSKERSGVVAEDSFEDDASSSSSEKVVSYSYRAAPDGHSKDVVYGSGAAAKPPASNHTTSARSPSTGHTISFAQSRSSAHTTFSQPDTTAPPVFAAFESSRISHHGTTPVFQHSGSASPSSASPPSSFFSPSFSPSPPYSSSPSPSPQSHSHASSPSSPHSSQHYASSSPPSPPHSFSHSYVSSPSPSPHSFHHASQFGHSEASFPHHHPHAPPATVDPADPSTYIIKESTFQPFPGAPTFTVPLPVPHNQITDHPPHASSKTEGLVGASTEAQSSYLSYEPSYAGTTERPIYQVMMEPFRVMGNRLYKAAYPVLKPMMKAGHQISKQLKLNEFRGTLDDEALPVVAGVGALSAISLAVLAIAISTNTTTFDFGKRSIDDDDPALYFLDRMEGREARGEGILARLMDSPEAANDQHTSPWCSRRVLCDAMTFLPDDYLFAFEKRLQLFLDMLSDSKDKSPLRETAEGFIEAVRQRQCDRYTCGDAKVDSSQIMTDTSGPR